MTTTTTFEQTLEKFIASDDFAQALEDATRASWAGESRNVELFPDGHYRLLWGMEIGNKYISPGEILSIPAYDDSDWTECHDNSMDDATWFMEAFSNESDELAKELREKLAYEG